MNLAALSPGNKAVICEFGEQGDSLVHRMMEMGLTPGAELEVVHRSPFGGAVAVRCRGTLIAIRLTDARAVVVKRVDHGA